MSFEQYIENKIKGEEMLLKQFTEISKDKKTNEIKIGIKIYQSRISMLKSIKHHLEMLGGSE